MKKIIHPCDVPMWDGKKYPMFCEIIYEKGRLSICGVIGPRKSGNAKGGAGQIDSDFYHPTIRRDGRIKAGDLRFTDGWNRETWYKFIRYWNQWHLNDLHAECIHQEQLGWTYKTHAGLSCPECGYEIGTAWTMREVPSWVIQFLFSLPDTDKTPAWV